MPCRRLASSIDTSCRCRVAAVRPRWLTRDLYVPAGDIGFWQGAFRDPAAPEFLTAAALIKERKPLMIELLYGDYEGGQRTISRFAMQPRSDAGWLVTVSRHWNIDRADPR
jgi:hypothetical protein